MIFKFLQLPIQICRINIIAKTPPKNSHFYLVHFFDHTIVLPAHNNRHTALTNCIVVHLHSTMKLLVPALVALAVIDRTIGLESHYVRTPKSAAKPERQFQRNARVGEMEVEYEPEDYKEHEEEKEPEHERKPKPKKPEIKPRVPTDSVSPVMTSLHTRDNV